MSVSKQTRGTFGPFFAALLAAIEHAKSEYNDDGKITPAEVLDVLLTLVSAVASMLPNPVRALASLFISAGHGILAILGEEPGPDTLTIASSNNVVARVVTRETAKLLGNKAEVSMYGGGSVSTRLRAPKRTGKIPAAMRRNKAAES